jgi:tRNA A-37 threonylcarbamoyl transferase component Bud32
LKGFSRVVTGSNSNTVADGLSASVIDVPVPRETIPRSEWPKIPGYSLEAELGSGGYGIVFDCREDSALRIRRAAKVLYPSPFTNPATASDRFIRESRALSSLSHPQVVKYVNSGFSAEGRPFVVMDFVEGKGLGDACGTIDAETAARIVAAMLSALSYCHSQGVIHRDVKPSNVMLAGDNLPILLDFGISHLLDEKDARDRITKATVGTPGYISPEAERDPLHATPGNDVYSTGVVLYQLIAGHLPLKNRIDALAGMKGADLDLDRIVARALAPEGERYPSADLFRADLEEWLSAVQTRARIGGSLALEATRIRKLALEREKQVQEDEEKKKKFQAILRGFADAASADVLAAGREAFRAAVAAFHDLGGGWEMAEPSTLEALMGSTSEGKRSALVGARNRKYPDWVAVLERRRLSDAGVSEFRAKSSENASSRRHPLLPTHYLGPLFYVARYSERQDPVPIDCGQVGIGVTEIRDNEPVDTKLVVAILGASTSMKRQMQGRPLGFVIGDVKELASAVLEMAQEAMGQADLESGN